MNWINTRANKAFYGVAIFVILAGAVALAVGIVELVMSYMGDWHFGWPALKILLGLIVLALGYIILELELLRHKQ